MNTSGPGERAKRVGFLELFFDLVFVFAVTQLVAVLYGDHSAAGWGRAAVPPRGRSSLDAPTGEP